MSSETHLQSYASRLSVLIVPLLTILVLATCGKDSATNSQRAEPPAPPPVQLVPTSIVITPSVVTLTSIGQTVSLTAEVRDQNGQTMTGANLTWSSDTGTIATVSAQGLVTAVHNGTANITARSGSASTQVTVTVMQSAVRITIEPGSATLMSVGETVQLVATVYDQNGQTVQDAVVSWTSDGEAIATVSAQGLVTAVHNGTANITARLENVNQSIQIIVSLSDGDVTVGDDRITWKTAGNVPGHELLALQEELEMSMEFIFHKSGYKATGFTILVGESYKALAPVFMEVTGRDLSFFHLQQYSYSNGFVTSSVSGGAVMVLIYSESSDSFDRLHHYIVHEYFHVLQGQLASGFELTENGDTAWHIRSSDRSIGHNVAPQWMIEGLASYADFLYSKNRPGRRPFFDRYSPYGDLGRAIVRGGELFDPFSDLAKTVSYSDAQCTFGHFYFYALSFVASQYLAEASTTPHDNYVEFWRLLGEMPMWEDAFNEAFGITFQDLVQGFPEWLAPRLPEYSQVAVQITWPDMDTNPLVRWETFSLILDDVTTDMGNAQWFTGSLKYDYDTQEIVLRIVFPTEQAILAKLGLRWTSGPDSDLCLVGWYKDGELTDHIEDAKRMTFTRLTEDFVWILPDHPKNLVQLECIEIGQ